MIIIIHFALDYTWYGDYGLTRLVQIRMKLTTID